MEKFLLIIEIPVFVFVAFMCLYTLILSISGRFGYISINLRKKTNEIDHNIAVLIPAYKEDAVIQRVILQMSQLDYPPKCYDVFVIADSMKKSTIERIKKLANVIEVSFTKSTKSKSLNYALSVIPENYDIAVISDGDNILSKDFLKFINKAYNRGAKAIQGQRVAKNTNTKMAILDAVSEELNNHIYRRGLNGVGLSSAIIGSGMAFDYQLLKKLMQGNLAVGGFDKILQLSLLENHIKIHYVNEAVTFDEKIESIKSFQNQRKRWISAQIKYFTKNFTKGWSQLFKGNFDFFNISIICGMIPPRIFFIGFLIMISMVLLLFPGLSQIGSFYWIGITVLYLLSFFISIPRMLFHRAFLLALLQLPAAFMNMLLALVKIKKADEDFIHTSHTNSTISNVFRKD